MRMLKTIFLALGTFLMFFLSGCTPGYEKQEIVINLQPYDEIDDLSEVKQHLTEYFKEIGLENCRVEILKHDYTPYFGGCCPLCDLEAGIKIPRLRADSMVNYLSTQKAEYNIGVTDKDISCSVHGVKDFGVLGLSYLRYRKNASMVSTYRIKDKKDLWKVVAHEFTHGFFNMSHCKADDPSCIMQDAKKKPKLEIKQKLCSACMAEVTNKMDISRRKWVERSEKLGSNVNKD